MSERFLLHLYIFKKTTSSWESKSKENYWKYLFRPKFWPVCYDVWHIIQLTNDFSEIFKLIGFVSPQIDQWFHRINTWNHGVHSTFTPVRDGRQGWSWRRMSVVIAPVGLRWIEQNLAFGPPHVRDPKGRTEFLELADDGQEVDMTRSWGVEC